MGNIFQIEARSQEEAFDNIFKYGLIEDIEDIMLDNDVREITIEYGDCVPYTYKGSDDCEWQEIGEFEVTDSELDIDWFETAKTYKELFEKTNEKYNTTIHQLTKIKKELECIKNKE